MKRHMLPVCLLCLCAALAKAQDLRPYRYYATQQSHQVLLEQYPGYQGKLDAMEALVREYGESGNDRLDTVTVVFHVLYTEGLPYPSLEQVSALMEVLNHDFGAYEAPAEPYQSEQLQAYANLAQKMGITFCLPMADVAGTLTDPIKYVPSSTTEWPVGNGMKASESGGADPLDPSKYLNIWVCNLAGNLAGFAQMPGGPEETDGIVVDFDFLPGFVQDDAYPYKQGKALTHLVGNYLGLYDLWNDKYPCTDDFVWDTPIHNAPNYEVPAPDVRHISLCPLGPIDEMVMNYMDNTDDGGQNMFTLGQKSRIKAVLSENGPRSGLKSGPVSCDGQMLGLGGAGIKGGNTKTARKDGSSLQLHPNPTSGNLTIRLKGSNGVAKVMVFDGYGAKMLETDCMLEGQKHVLKLHSEDWPSGPYFVSAVFADKTALSTIFSIIR